MLNTAARSTKGFDLAINRVFNGLMETMGRIMAMFTLGEAV